MGRVKLQERIAAAISEFDNDNIELSTGGLEHSDKEQEIKETCIPKKAEQREDDK
ncbi:MAG: hypothetical protein HQK99_00665 [Nitrospirae bacterium]|nr:hypothetical protein [Nitrospirota bacterium]